MIVETRKTVTGTEYWDAKEKRVRFVPAGEEPTFEVTANPTTMIVNGETTENEIPNVVALKLEEMTITELKSYAKELDIEIPDDVKKKSDIILLLSEAE